MNKLKQNAVFWGTAGTLFVFWVLITWRFHWQTLLMGVFCSLAVAVFNNELLLKKEERSLLTFAAAGRWLVYFGLLITAVLKANWDVAKIVLRPNMDISPGFVKYRTTVKKPVNRVILGNSITLTPGTLTVEVEEDVFVVHALTRGCAEDVATWDMMDRIRIMEEADHAR